MARRRREQAIQRPHGMGRIVEWVKSILLVLLAISAIYLSLRTGVYNNWVSSNGSLLGEIRTLWEHPTVNLPETMGTAKPTAAAAPVRMAVYSEGVRYGTQYDDAQTSVLYANFSGLLGEALSSLSSPVQVEEAVFQQALQQTGVYFDFLVAVPLSALQRWLVDSTPGDALFSSTARQFILAHDTDDSIVLYYQEDSTGLYYACTTAMSYMGHLENAITGYNANDATFVFEYGEEAGYDGLDPYVMVLSSPPSPVVYQSATPVDLTAEATYTAIQELLAFPVQPNGDYRVSEGVVVRDENDTLRLNEDGTISFQAGEGEPRYPVEGEGSEAFIEVGRKLAQDTLGAYCGSAELTFSGLTQTGEDSYELRFSYLLNDTEVQLFTSGEAAWFLMEGGEITQYSLHFRTYAPVEGSTMILGELQAAAALNAINPKERFLQLCYEDMGGDVVVAGWVAR